MTLHAAPRREWLRRRLWRLWPDRNPLRRSYDRAEMLIIAGLVAAFVIGGPLAALAVGQWAYNSALHAEHAELAARHQVSAILVTAASGPQGWSQGLVRARWIAPGGAWRTGWVPAPAGALAGARVQVWVDAAGRPTEPPLRNAQVAGQAVLAATSAIFTLALVLGGAWLCVRRVVERRRLAAWEAEWRATGPKWSRHT